MKRESFRSRTIFGVVKIADSVLGNVKQLSMVKDNVASCNLVQGVDLGHAAATTSLVTGYGPKVHGVFTYLVPTGDVPIADRGSLVERGLRKLSSRDFGPPPTWSLLKELGVRCAAVGWPFADEMILRPKVKATGSGMTPQSLDCSLETMRTLCHEERETRCICFYHDWFNVTEKPRRPKVSFDQPEKNLQLEPRQDVRENELEEPTELTMESQAKTLLAWVEAMQRATTSDNVLIAFVGEKRGMYLLLGDRSAELQRTGGGLQNAAPTILDLLGLSDGADLPGRSLLWQADSESNQVRPVAGIGTSESKSQMTDVFKKAVSHLRLGEGGQLYRSVVGNYLIRNFWAAAHAGVLTTAREFSQKIVDLQPSPINLFRLALVQKKLESHAELRALLSQLTTEFEDSKIAKLASLLSPEATSVSKLSVILDQNPQAMCKNAIEQIVCARAAERVGRIDEVILRLRCLLPHGHLFPSDRLLIAKHCLNRNQTHDVSIALRACMPFMNLWRSEQSRQDTRSALVLCARALTMSGRKSASQKLVSQFVSGLPVEDREEVLFGIEWELGNVHGQGLR